MPTGSILITGSAGLIGRAVGERLAARGVDVIGIDLRAAKPDRRIDVRDGERLGRLVAGASGVVHLAAVSRVIDGERDPDRCWTTNVTATRQLLEAALAAPLRPWVIYASSREVYGQQETLPVGEDAPFLPMNAYAHTKVTAEGLVGKAREAGLPAAIIRFSNVYGRVEDYPDRVAPAFAAAAAEGGRLRVDGSGHGFDFTHIDDVGEAVVLVIEVLAAGERLPPLHLVSGRRTTLGELAALAVSHGRPGCRIVEAPPRSFDVRDFYGDPRRAEAVIGWRATTAVEDGIPRLVADFRARQAIGEAASP